MSVTHLVSLDIFIKLNIFLMLYIIFIELLNYKLFFLIKSDETSFCQQDIVFTMQILSTDILYGKEKIVLSMYRIISLENTQT